MAFGGTFSQRCIQSQYSSLGYCVPGIGAIGVVGAGNGFRRGYDPTQWIFHFQAVLPYWVFKGTGYPVIPYKSGTSNRSRGRTRNSDQGRNGEEVRNSSTRTGRCGFVGRSATRKWFCRVEPLQITRAAL